MKKPRVELAIGNLQGAARILTAAGLSRDKIIALIDEALEDH